MIKSLLTMFLIAVSLSGYSQISHKGTQFTAEEVAKANTAANTKLAQVDKDIITLCNLARLDGVKFWNSFINPYLSGKQSANVKSLKVDLSAVSNRPMLYPEASLCSTAEYHANDMGTSGKTGHNSTNGKSFAARVRAVYDGGAIAENCAYGNDKALDIVTQLLVDENVPSLGHRKSILNPDYVAIGVCTKPHKSWRYNTVQDFGDKLTTPAE